MDAPQDHPRYRSLVARHKLEEGVTEGITTLTGLVAHGRGEVFDYLLGERTHDFADEACRAAAALLHLAALPIISVNGNTAVLVPDEFVALSKETGAQLEINIFHESPERRSKIAARFRNAGVEILGVAPDALLPGLSSARARVDTRGMFQADVVLVSLEDGDRTQALVSAGKKVIAIDLNPLSRTPQTANIAIVDNVDRAIPCIGKHYLALAQASRSELHRIVDEFDNAAILRRAEQAIRQGDYS